MNKTLLIMCGLCCSGKSTTVKKLRDAFELELISNDLHRKESEFSKDNLNRNPLERFAIYYNALNKAEALLKQKRNVVIDGTFFLKILRQSAYYVAFKTDSNAYVVECVCNNYGLIQKRYGHRKTNNHLFKAWENIESYNVKFQEFEDLDREAFPDGRPVPIIRYDSEISRAEIVFSDGSRNIEEIVEAINSPLSERIYLKVLEGNL